MQPSYLGLHYPNGPVDNAIIAALSSPTLLMLSPEARYHYNEMRNKGKKIMWRALPRIGKRPAETGYKNLKANADECLNLWDEQPHYGDEMFVPYNELDLNYERGDTADDFDHLEERYYELTNFLYGLWVALRSRLPMGTKIFFPPWTPDHGDTEYVRIWKKAAQLYDGIVIHAYGDPKKMVERFNWYAEQFPDKPIFIGEWNSDTPADFLEELKALSVHPQFAGATYFIWHWHNAPDWWPKHYNVDENPELLKLFQEVNMPEFPDYPEPIPWSKDDIVKQVIKQAAKDSIPPRVLLALLYAESGLKWDSMRFAYKNGLGTYTNLTTPADEAINQKNYARLEYILNLINEKGSTDISFGLGQQTVRWADEGNQKQTVENVMYIRNKFFNVPYAIEIASRKLARYWRDYGDALEALCRYNKPQIEGKNNPNRGNYERAYKEVENLLKEENLMKVLVNSTLNIGGQFSTVPKGIILHGSRSGVSGNPKAREALGCSNWVNNNPSGMGWNATIGENEYYVHMPASMWGWNAFSASDDYLAVEFAQATVDEPITDAQVDAFVHYVKTQVFPIWPDIPLTLKTHAEVEASGETVQTSGKTDVFPYRDVRAEDLKARILKKLKGEPVPEPEFQFHFGFKVKAEELGTDVVGDPIEHETYLGDTYSYQFTTKGIMMYSKASNIVKFITTK